MRITQGTVPTSDAQLRAALDAMPHKVWLVRPEGPPLYYNRAMRAFGGDALDLPDRASREKALIHADDLPSVRSAAASAIADPKDFELELRLRDPAGNWPWHRLTVSMMRSGRRVDAWLVTATDIDDLRRAMVSAQQSNEQVRLTAETAQLGIFRLDLRTGERTWTPEMNAIFGLAPDAPPPRDILQVVHPEDRERVRTWLVATLNPDGPATVSSEHRILRPDGSIRWVLVKGGVFFRSEGAERKPVRSLGFTIDITERKVAEH